jgi:hypothetical protein
MLRSYIDVLVVIFWSVMYSAWEGGQAYRNGYYCKLKVSKVLIKYQAMKTYGCGGIVSLILSHAIKWRWVVSFTPRPQPPPPPPRKGPMYSQNRRLDGPQSCSGRYGINNFVHLPGSNSGSSVVQSIAWSL